jgi:hypothetical protein
MLTTNDVAKVYDTILRIPGMNETVKIDLKVSRRGSAGNKVMLGGIYSSSIVLFEGYKVVKTYVS